MTTLDLDHLCRACLGAGGSAGRTDGGGDSSEAGVLEAGGLGTG